MLRARQHAVDLIRPSKSYFARQHSHPTRTGVSKDGTAKAAVVSSASHDLHATAMTTVAGVEFDNVGRKMKQ